MPLIETCMDCKTRLGTRCGPEKQQWLCKSNFLARVQNSGAGGRAYYVCFYVLESREDVDDFLVHGTDISSSPFLAGVYF